MSLDDRRNEPLVRFFDAAPLDDEPESDEERAATAEVEADRAAGVASISSDENQARLPGLVAADA